MTPLAQSQSSQRSSTNPTPTSSTLKDAKQRAVPLTNTAQGRGSPVTQRATSPPPIPYHTLAQQLAFDSTGAVASSLIVLELLKPALMLQAIDPTCFSRRLR
ncbi:hypothetical protein FRC02_004123 [Tulasnella sp. 418]|nr:hypothetical protein FRC02_004123 [Tulasnella sp. 418]